ncbi:MAG: Flp pilus assembly complex ATPase component TadA [Actinobacteria bacterium]|nr:Flp pilus assembly complex ATPase component TadA [Actinomycetota bacterium]
MYNTAGQCSGKIRLGELLVAFGIITQEQLEDALFEQKKSGRRLGHVLRQLGYVSEETMIEFLGKQLNIPSIDLEQVVPDKEVVNLIPEAIARRHKVIPVSRVGNVLTLAMPDPLDVFAIDDVAGISGCDINAVVSTERSVLKAIDKYYWIQETAPDADADVTYSTDHSEKLIDNANMADGSAVKLVNMIIRQAVNDRASDIHIEPDERQLRIRNRVDGILHEVMTALMSMHAEVVSRLKIMADLDIAEKRAPQDGRFSVDTGNDKIDIRISTVPTIFGEKIVLRLLEKKAIMVGEEKLGFDERDLPRFRRMINRPYGMILVAGPTGSGKTTTLYTALNIIADVEKNVVTIEDPVEYKLALTNQIQVNPKAGVTFASGLRSILRQDPDVIMVGEIRDKETADIAVHAALSGHLVFSTIHTNDAPSTAARFIEMGIEPFLASSAILGIIAQRLVRLLCEHCKEEYAPTPELLDELGLSDAPNLLFYRPHGCIECKGTGYKGREAIFEILEVDEEIKNLIVAKAPAARIRDAALRRGFRTLRDAGLAKIVQGKTSVEAVLRVTQEAEVAADD